jgi:hypothetical protein
MGEPRVHHPEEAEEVQHREEEEVQHQAEEEVQHQAEGEGQHQAEEEVHRQEVMEGLLPAEAEAAAAAHQRWASGAAVVEAQMASHCSAPVAEMQSVLR